MSQLLKRLFIFVTMEVNDKLINKLAVLSRLRFNEDEKQTIKKDLEQMIHFVSKLQEVDTDEVPPLLHISQNVNCMRTDIAEGTISRQEALKMLLCMMICILKCQKLLKIMDNTAVLHLEEIRKSYYLGKQELPVLKALP